MNRIITVNNPTKDGPEHSTNNNWQHQAAKKAEVAEKLGNDYVGFLQAIKTSTPASQDKDNDKEM